MWDWRGWFVVWDWRGGFIVWDWRWVFLERIWELFGNCLELSDTDYQLVNIFKWELFGNCLGIVWELFGNFKE